MQTFFHRVAGAVLLAATSVAASAADFEFSGNIAFHNDVVQVRFTVANDATNVRLWTDSYQSGVNFDPVTSLFAMPSGALIGQNDDFATIAPGQTSLDSGLIYDTLVAGDYLFTVATYNNFALGALNQGFRFDKETPIALAAWCQPDSDCTQQKGTFWRVHLTGVEQAAAPVPEPASAALLALGLCVTAAAAVRRGRRA